jgi:hypothetical protein
LATLDGVASTLVRPRDTTYYEGFVEGGRYDGLPDRIEELRQLAAERGVQPTALIRVWVLAQLDAARSRDDYVQRWEREVRATADQLRKLLDERPGASWADAS